MLPKWSPNAPGYSILLGMHAFGLEEAGDYVRAEQSGRRAVELQPLDCWAHHAVAHVMEMQGRAEDGIGWMIAREPHWSGDSNFFKVHNWWHRALYHLEIGQVDEVLKLYDGPIRRECSAVAMDLIDASALLWRLHISGHDVGDRWNELAATWDAHSDGGTYPFNDWHAVMAYLGAGREKDVQRILAAFQNSGDDKSEVGVWDGTRHCSRRSLQHFGMATTRLRSNGYMARAPSPTALAAAMLSAISSTGTLTEAAVRGQLGGIAEALSHERLALKPHSPVNRQFLSRSRDCEGNNLKAA